MSINENFSFKVEEMNVCDNLGDHLVGNVYVKFKKEEVGDLNHEYILHLCLYFHLQDAEKACSDLNNRWFGGRPIYAELTPVTDFREACCRQYETGECTRSGFCNFMHLKPISRKLRGELYGRQGKRDDRARNTVDLKVTKSEAVAVFHVVFLQDEIDQERKRGGRDRERDRERRRERSRDRDRRRDRSRDRGGRY